MDIDEDETLPGVKNSDAATQADTSVHGTQMQLMHKIEQQTWFPNIEGNNRNHQKP